MGGPSIRLHFGDFVLDLARAELRRGPVVVQLQPQVFDGLCWFARHPGVLHTRASLHAALWPGVHVADDALSQLIRKIRVGLDDVTQEPVYLETVPRRGYRFIAPVTEVAEPSAEAPAPRTPASAPAAPLLHGRETDLDRVSARLTAGAAIVTITGTGGMGKSHLARAAVVHLAPGFDGHIVVDLQDTRDDGGLLLAIASALDVPLQGDSPDDHAARLAHGLEARGHFLCVLDDLDRLHGVVERRLDAWRTAAPHIRWLLTARRPLGLREEQVVDLAPLPRAGSRALFRARAQALGSQVLASDDELDPLLDKLDDSPLAIELAAARTRVLGVADLARRMDAPLKILHDRHGQRPARHQSLHACLLASWEPLPPAQQEALAALTVFPASIPPATAEALLAAAFPHVEPLDVLDDLRAHALLHVDRRANGHVLLKVLESVAALVRGTDATAPARTRAAQLVVATLADRIRALASVAPTDPHHRQDITLLVAMLDGLTDPHDLVDALDVTAPWLRESGPLDVAHRAVARALAGQDALSPLEQARLAVARLELIRDHRGDLDALSADARARAEAIGSDALAFQVELDSCDRSARLEGGAIADARSLALLAWATRLSDPLAVAAARRFRARLLLEAGRHDELWRLLDGALDGLPDTPVRAGLLDVIGLAEAYRGNPDGCERAMNEALAIYQRLGWTRRIAVQHANLAGQLIMRGDREPAVRHLERSREAASRIGDPIIESTVLINLGVQHLFELDHRAAETVLQRAHRIAPDTYAAVVQFNLSTAAWLAGDLSVALERADLGVAIATRQEEARHRALNLAWRAALLAGLGRCAEANDALLAAKADFDAHDAAGEEVLSLVGLHLAAARGEPIVVPEPPHSPRAALLIGLLHRDT